jgi:pimeloyl-ACP methyl ester carboxylesterase
MCSRGGTGKNSYGQHESGDLAGAITWLNDHKQTHPENISVIGASMGGAAATVYAAENSIDTLLLLSPIIDINAAKRTALKNRYFILPNVYATGGTLVERLFFGIMPTNPADVFNTIKTPTLVMHARDDKLAPVSTIYELEAQMKKNNQSNVQFVYLDTAGHAFLDADKANGFPYSQQILEFIKNN